MTYTVRDVAGLLDLQPAVIRRYVRAGFLGASRDERGNYRFSFQDVVLLRTAKTLSERVKPHRVRRALKNLREQLPAEQCLTGLRITAEGGAVVVRDGSSAWQPDSGQVVLDFEIAELATLTELAVHRKPALPAGLNEKVEALYAEACAVESGDPDHGIKLYWQVLEIDPDHVDARINVGRLLHERGEVDRAEGQYRTACDVAPDDPTAAFNLGVALEDLGRYLEALQSYQTAMRLDQGFADAYYNAAAVCERLDKKQEAIDYLARYRRLVIRSV